MSLGPDSWCLHGNLPRHKLRAYGRVSAVHGGAEYRRLLNFLSKHASQGERELLNVTPVPTFAQVPSIVNRRLRAPQNGWAPPVVNNIQPETRPSAPPPVEELLNEMTPQFIRDMENEPQPMDGMLNDIPVQQFVQSELLGVGQQRESAQPANNICFAPPSDINLSITMTEAQSDFAASYARAPRAQGPSQRAMARLQRWQERSRQAAQWQSMVFLPADEKAPSAGLEALEREVSQLTFEPSEQPVMLHADVSVKLVEEIDVIQNEDGQFLGHLSVLLNEWFGKEILQEEAEPVQHEIDSPEKRRERTYAALRKAAAERRESKRLMEKLGQVTPDERSKELLGMTGTERVEPLVERRSTVDRRSNSSRRSPSVPVSKPAVPEAAWKSASSGRGNPHYAENRRRARHREVRQEPSRQVSPLPNGMRKEELSDGAFVLKDAVGRVTEARSHDGAIMSFSYDNRGHLKSFVRSDLSGKIHTTGLKDKHGVIVRDDHGALKAQGDSMTVDTNGCVSIRKFDGQFWSLDVLRGIHIERRILEDVNGSWNCLTALLTCDGFRMVTRFQKMQESKRESYRKYGDWLGGLECSKFRFYGRDGSMIEFENDEDLEALRPSRILPAGSRPVDHEWVGRRQAGTAWDAVHRYISQYLSAL